MLIQTIKTYRNNMDNSQNNCAKLKRNERSKFSLIPLYKILENCKLIYDRKISDCLGWGSGLNGIGGRMAKGH